MLRSKIFTLISGMVGGLVFAPIFFFPGLITLSILCYQVRQATSFRQAIKIGFIYGFGHFLTNMYWITFGVAVYIDQFWWLLPFSLFGFPLILAPFISATCICSWYFKSSYNYNLIFSTLWIFFEWLRSWIFTGLPWNLLGYSLSFSTLTIQPSSVVGIYGLSFIVIYTFNSLSFLFSKEYSKFYISSICSIIICSVALVFSYIKLENNPTVFSNITARLVQPSIAQIAKWDEQSFWQNLDAHIALSTSPGKADLIIWSEAAVVAPFEFPPLKNKILAMLAVTDNILITGGINESNATSKELEIYSSMYATRKEGDILFEYFKSHLVPFGEYVPFKNFFPIKKITAGFLDYSPGKAKIVDLPQLNLSIKPLICYESIFPQLALTPNTKADLIVNVTNDAWYGNSSGPYQHFQISRLRAVENGLPLLRVANNGVSAVIDPVGRIVQKLSLNKVGVIDSLIPIKLNKPTLYSKFGNANVIVLILVVLIIQSIGNYREKKLLYGL